MLTFVGRGTSARDYDRLKAGLDRLQSTTVMTSIRQPTERRRHRFSWIDEWKETADPHGRPLGLELILLDCFYAGVLDEALVLTVDRAYFELTGGLERWLYRLVRKHGGRQEGGWSFDLKHLHAKSGSLSPLKHFAYDVRKIVRRERLPGYRPSGTGSSCYRGPESDETPSHSIACRARNFSNSESFGFFLTDRAFFAVEDKWRSAARCVSIGGLWNQQDGFGSTVVLQLSSFIARQFSDQGRAA